MTIKDLIELAKAGYKPSDIKELLELGNTDPEIKAASVSDLNIKKDPDENKKAEPDNVDAFAELVKNSESKKE
ncbi:hypothetical protein J6V85_00735 [Candidatus Saccharibacteria bacterium]|nr:hypothetical protein [Candidatus Saccharibacteria bacterium]